MIDLLAQIERQGRANDEQQRDHTRKMLNLEPETARLLNILARSSRAKRALEIGTSNGYSTICLASAVAETGGKVISIERSPEKRTMARDNLVRAGLLDYVDLRLGEATAIVRELSGPFDFVFFDGDRLSAPEQVRLLVPKLTPAVLILADNVLSHPAEIAGYLAAVSRLEAFEHMVVPVGKGLSLAYRGAGPTAEAIGRVE
ncbi:MAG TPA: class I SAM-dependent methyltransferase [Candidatus Acidoferrales bacterium]|nr:class I SAM-dependent methyltransferase [Candidatus Acidoferrales bacterium]